MFTPSSWVTERNIASEVQGYTLRWIAGCDDRRAAGQTSPWEEANPQARQVQRHRMVPVPSKRLDNLLSLTLDVWESIQLEILCEFSEVSTFLTRVLSVVVKEKEKT